MTPGGLPGHPDTACSQRRSPKPKPASSQPEGTALYWEDATFDRLPWGDFSEDSSDKNPNGGHLALDPSTKETKVESVRTMLNPALYKTASYQESNDGGLPVRGAQHAGYRGAGLDLVSNGDLA